MAHYSTLVACVNGISSDYHHLASVMVPGYDLATMDSSGEIPAPAVVFRGEANAAWDSTVSSMERLRTRSGLSVVQQREIEALTEAIDQHVRKWFRFSMPATAGLFQHYGLPTELIDVTPRLEVAAFFAAFDNTSGTGAITIFPMDRVTTVAKVFDLSMLAFAQRPVSQLGFGLFHDAFRNLRAQGFANAVKTVRHTFNVTADDIAKYVTCQPSIVQPYTDAYDPARAVITHLVDLYARKISLLSPAAARYLAGHVAPTPLTVTGGDFSSAEPVFEIGRRRDAPEPYSDGAQIELNWRRWHSA